MVYRALGALFSDSGLSIALVEFHENAGLWTFEVKTNNSYPGGNINSLIPQFLEENNLGYKVALVTIHSDRYDTTFNGAPIAATTELPVICDLPVLDRELGGNGEFYSSCFQKLNLDSGDNTDLNKTVCVAFMGVLRWREEYNFLSSVTGATRSNIGGAVWLGQDA